jgi:hypothetical protein
MSALTGTTAAIVAAALVWLAIAVAIAIAAARRFRLDEITPIGPDVRLVARPAPAAAPRAPDAERVEN